MKPVVRRQRAQALAWFVLVLPVFISVIGLAILFGILFGLRVLHIFPPEPGQDAEIAAARATQAALGTQEALAPRPTVAVGSAPAAATSAVQVRPAATPGLRSR